MEDVIAGSLIGTFSAAICYLSFWPNPFRTSSFNSSGRTEARYLYISAAHSRGAYELTATNDNVV
jgi:diacylglycerol diphosphate phosphatase/phosphatidate phosphatase